MSSWKVIEAAYDDLDEIMVVEAECFEDPFPRAEWDTYIGNDNRAILIVRSPDNGNILAFVAYDRSGPRWTIKRMACIPGSAATHYAVVEPLLCALKNWAAEAKDPPIHIRVVARDSNATALRVFSKSGFKAIAVYPQKFPDKTDGILMRYSLNPSAVPVSQSARISQTNRVSKFYKG